MKYNKSFCLFASCVAITAAAADIDGTISFQSNQVGNTNSALVEGNKYFGNFNFSYHDAAAKSFRKNVNVAAQVNDANDFMYSIKEANMVKDWGRNQVAAGKMKIDWNELDQTWGYGFINNRQNFDLYNPDQEGLIGFKWDRNFRRFNVSLFASTFYIPELQPGLEVEDGQVIRKSPWARSVPTSINSMDRDVGIYYDVNMPQAKDVVFKQSLGLNFGYDSKSTEFNVFAVRKPENNPRVSGVGEYNDKRGMVDAKITPEFVYHNVTGATLAKKYKDYRVYISSVNEYPDKHEIKETDETTAIQDERGRKNYVGIGSCRVNDKQSIGINYVQLVDSDSGLEDDELKFKKAINLNWSRKIGKKINVDFDYKYDLVSKDQIIQHNAAYLMDRNMSLAVGLKIISAPNDESYWAEFRDQDMAYSSFTYLF